MLRPDVELRIKAYQGRKEFWGPWRLDAKRLVLTFQQGRYWYELDLERMNTSAQILDYVMQVYGHTAWATPEVMYALLDAIQEVIDPQANVCSWGIEKP